LVFSKIWGLNPCIFLLKMLKSIADQTLKDFVRGSAPDAPCRVMSIIHEYMGCDVSLMSSTACLSCVPRPFTCMVDESRSSDPARLSVKKYIRQTHESWGRIIVFLDRDSKASPMKRVYQDIGRMLKSLHSQCTLSIAGCDNHRVRTVHDTAETECQNLRWSVAHRTSSLTTRTLLVMEDNCLWEHCGDTMRRDFFSRIRSWNENISIMGIIPNRCHLKCRIDVVMSLDDLREMQMCK
jgi:hypothetical protein